MTSIRDSLFSGFRWYRQFTGGRWFQACDATAWRVSSHWKREQPRNTPWIKVLAAEDYSKAASSVTFGDVVEREDASLCEEPTRAAESPSDGGKIDSPRIEALEALAAGMDADAFDVIAQMLADFGFADRARHVAAVAGLRRAVDRGQMKMDTSTTQWLAESDERITQIMLRRPTEKPLSRSLSRGVAAGAAHART